jgi:hypothetical protein
MGGYFNPGYGPRSPLPTPEQYRVMAQKQREEEAAAQAAKQAEEQAAEDAFQKFNPGLRPRVDSATGKPQEKDYVGDYIQRNPGASKHLLDTAQPYKAEASAPQTNITAPAVAENQKWMESETARRTIRQLSDGSFTNQGNEGAVVMKNGESVGPDIGAPGRGTVSQPSAINNPMDDPNYRNYSVNLRGPEETADMAKAESERKMFEILQRNPFAREAIMAQMQGQQQQQAIDRTYGQERAKQGAKLEALNQLDAMEQELRDEIERDSETPQVKADALAKLAEWRSRQEVALGMRDRPDVGI